MKPMNIKKKISRIYYNLTIFFFNISFLLNNFWLLFRLSVSWLNSIIKNDSLEMKHLQNNIRTLINFWSLVLVKMSGIFKFIFKIRILIATLDIWLIWNLCIIKMNRFEMTEIQIRKELKSESHMAEDSVLEIFSYSF